MICISREQSLGRGFAILSIASITVKLMSLVFVPVMRSALGSSGYGVFSSANAVFAFVYAITTTGLPVAVSKLVTEMTATGNHKQARQSFRLARTLMFCVGLICTVVMIIFAKPLARMMNNENSWLGIAFIAPTLLICAILSAYRGYFQGLRNMTPTALSQVIEQLVHVVVAIVMVYILRNQGIVWAVAGASMGTAVGAAAALIIVLKYNKGYEREYAIIRKSDVDLYSQEEYSAKKLMRTLIYYSIPITLNSAILYGGNMVDASVLLGRLADAGFDSIQGNVLHGDLYAAQQLINVPASLVSALCVSMLPVIAAAYKMREFDSTVERANYCFKLCFMVTLPFATAMTVYAEPIYALLRFGSNYRILSSLAFSIALMALMHLQSSIMQSVNRLFTATCYLGVGIAVKIVLNYILVGIPSLNVYGAIISTYVAYLIPSCMNYYTLRKKMGLNISLLNALKWPTICSCLMVAISLPVYLILDKLVALPVGYSYISNLIVFLPTVVVAVVVYFFSLRRSGWLLDDDIRTISPRLARLFRVK